MLFYSYPIAAGANDSLQTVSHAHNYGLQVLSEQGLVGLLLLVTIAVLVVHAGVRRLRAHGREESDWRDTFQIGVLAALIARTVEQGSGVGRVSDLMLFWALVGLSVALVEMRQSADLAVTSPTATRRSRRRNPDQTKANIRRVGVYAASAIVGILALIVFVQHDINPLRGGRMAANAFEQKAQGNENSALASFREAARLAPDVERYRTEIAGLLSRTAIARTEPSEIDNLLLAARAELLRFEERNPYAWQTQIDLATVTSQLVANGHGELNGERAARYLNVSDLMPTFKDIQSIAAEQIVLAGDYDSGLAVANRAVGLESATRGDARAWWARGEAAYQLGLAEDALLSFETSLARGNTGRYAVASHRGLAFLAEEAGNPEESAEHHAKADALDR
jgi:hypothetical protein